MSEYSTWDESKGRIADRLEQHEAVLKAIGRNLERLVWLLLTGIFTLAAHAVLSYVQMAAQ